MNMFREFLQVFTLICVTRCEYSLSYSTEDLYAILDRTTEYFKNLSDAHDMSNSDTSNIINNEIAKYMSDMTKTILQRSKREKRDLQNEPSKGVYVLQGFEETLSLDLPDFEDTTFFSLQDEHQLLWFAAAVNFSDILLYQLINNKAQLVATYPQPNGKRIITHDYSAGTHIVVQKDDGVVILRLKKTENGLYELQFKQEFEIPGVAHINMWIGMNQLHLGIASETKISIYVWLAENFDKIDTLPYRARKLLPFQSKSFMHLVVVGSLTKILRFSVRSNKFVEIQKLHRANDASSFHFKEGHFEERFLVLPGNESTILYKEMYGRFVPFQKFTPTRQIHSLAMGNIVVVFLVEQDTVGIYQYNGWRFVRLRTQLSNLRQIRLYEDKLVAQNQAGEWKFLTPTWTVKKTWRSLQDETVAWCSEIKHKTSQRTLKNLPDLKSPVISNAHIGQLRTQNLKDQNVKELVHLMKRYNSTIAKLNLTSSLLAQMTENRSKHAVLHGKKITVKCKTNCHVHRIITDDGIKPTARHVESSNMLKFASLKAKMINNWKCPIPNFKIDDIFIKGSINGILMRDLQERTLKVSGDQEIAGNHRFANLHVTNASIPLNIATRNVTEQIVNMKMVKVKNLHLTENEYFLWLNGPAAVMDNSITAAKVRVTGPVAVVGTLTGKGIEKLNPMKEIFTSWTLYGDHFLQNVTFRNFVKAEDIVRSRGFSVKEILENSVPLDSNVSVHLILSSDKTQWSNVTLWDFINTNLVTKNSAKTIVISGEKYTNNSVTLSSAVYKNLAIPKLTISLCAKEVISPEIRTSLKWTQMNDIIVKNLNVSHVLGAHNLYSTVFDTASALHSINPATKLFTDQAFVKNISASEIKGINLKDLKIAMNEKVGINYFRGPVNVTKLVVENLETPAYFNLSLPRRVKNVIIKGDSDIGNINDINIKSFMENVLKVNDSISLGHVTFVHGFTSSNVHASRSTLKLSQLDTQDTYLNLGSKQISTTLSTDAIDVPQTFGYITSDAPSTFIIQGSAKFLREPIVQNINDVNLKQLSENLWMVNEDTVLSGSNINFENITLRANIFMKNYNNSLNKKMWKDIECKFLSKTKNQLITAVSLFKNVEVPNIHAENNSSLQSSDFNLNNLLTNSLMKNTAQTVDAAWHFEELYIDNMSWDGKFNGIDLNTDIVRRDAKHNTVTGRKTILGLTTKNLRALNINFYNFTKYALTEKCQKLSIKGQKIFNNLTLNSLSLKGTIMDRNVNDALLKLGNQTVFGTKRIQGQLNVPSLIIDGTVNDVNLTDLMSKQMKKRKTVQTIENKMDFRNDLEIVGNITIGGLYEGVNLTNITGRNKIDIALNRMTEVGALTEDIITALQNRAVYMNKFEVIDENALQIAINASNTEDIKQVNVNSNCLCKSDNISSFCNDTELFNIVGIANARTFMTKKLILLDDTVFVVLVSTDLVTIYSHVDAEFHHVAELYVPDILEASMESIDYTLWIFLRLSEETLILRYHVWNEFEKYVLPGSNSFVISKMPNGQHLLIRSDGMWNLGGVFYPEHVFKMSLEGRIETFALGTDYYVKATTEDSMTILKARYVGN